MESAIPTPKPFDAITYLPTLQINQFRVLENCTVVFEAQEIDLASQLFALAAAICIKKRDPTNQAILVVSKAEAFLGK